MWISTWFHINISNPRSSMLRFQATGIIWPRCCDAFVSCTCKKRVNGAKMKCIAEFLFFPPFYLQLKVSADVCRATLCNEDPGDQAKPMILHLKSIEISIWMRPFVAIASENFPWYDTFSTLTTRSTSASVTLHCEPRLLAPHKCLSRAIVHIIVLKCFGPSVVRFRCKQ